MSTLLQISACGRDLPATLIGGVAGLSWSQPAVLTGGAAGCLLIAGGAVVASQDPLRHNQERRA